MKRIISLFLAIVMLLSVMPSTIILAEEIDKFGFTKDNDKALTSNLTQGKPADDQTTLRWDFDKSGKYKLTYYIKDGDNTRKVELGFDVSGINEVTTSINLEKLSSDKDPNKYRQDVYPYTGETTSWKEITDPNNIKGLKINGSKVEETQLSVLMGENLKVRMKLTGKSMMLTTDGIQKGCITRFDLTYEGNGSVEKGIGTVVDFKGLESFDITPTHLEGNTLKSIFLIEDKNKDDIEDENKDDIEGAGKKPGIKVRIKKPFYINENGEFEVLKSDAAKDIKVSLALWPEFEPNQIGNTSSEQNINLQFDLGSDSPITGMATSLRKTTHTDGDYVEVYLSKEEIEDSTYVIKWDQLKESSIIGANIQMEYNITTNKGEEKAVLGDKLYQPDNKGYTFLSYEASKTGEQEIELTLTPYKMNSKARYTVYRKQITGNSDIYQGVNASDLSQGSWIKDVEYTYIPGNSTSQQISIGISKAIEQEYVITAELEDQTKPFISQRLYFNPTNIQAPPKVTQIVNIDNIYAIPGQEDASLASTPIEAAGFDIEWNAPKTEELISLLGKGDLYYELLVRSTDKETEEPALIKTFRVRPKDRENLSKKPEIIVEVVAGTARGVGINDQGKVVGEYYPATGTFKVSGVALKIASQVGWEQVQTSKVEFPYKDNKEYPETTLSHELYNEIPGTYYFSMRTILVEKDNKENGIGLIANTNESNLMSASIDIVSSVLPTVETIKGKAHTESDEDQVNTIAEYIYFNNVDITKYVDTMLSPAGWKLDEKDKYKGSYEVFLYTLKDGASQYSVSDFDAAVNEGYKSANTSQSNRFDMSDDDLTKLRNNGIIAMKYDTSNMNNQREEKKLLFTNLDPNQVYYVGMRVKLEPWRIKEDNSIEYQKPRYKTSVMSKVFSFTTSTKPMPTVPDDKVPPTPTKFFIKDQPNNTTVILGWEPADIEEEQDVTYYYELVKSKDIRLTEEQLKRKVEVDKLVNSKDIVGFDTKESDIRIFTSDNKKWETLIPKQSSGKTLTDSTLFSNTIYYYYIRTVCMVGEEKVNSSWIMLPVTTSMIETPRNLKVESPKTYNHDTKTTAVISFDATIPAGAKIPDDYEFEIAVKGEEDDTYSTGEKYPYSMVTSEVKEDLSGYTHFVYKIIGLTPNRRYDFKVRVLDKTHGKEGENYPGSLYTNSVTTRTDYDEQTAIEEEKFKEYLEAFDSETEKLKRRPYWIVDEGTYKYRASYINTEIVAKSQYELISDEKDTNLYYYMPANVLDRVSENSTILEINLGSYKLYIRPNTLTTDNSTIAEAIEKVSDGRLEDYYIAINLYTGSSIDKVNNEKTLSPQISVAIDLVYMKQEDNITEDDIMSELLGIIAEQREEFEKDLEEEVKKGSLNSDHLQSIVDEYVNKIEKQHIARTKRIINNKTQRIYAITNLEKPMLLTTKVESSGVNGYYYMGGNWVAVDAYAVGSGFAIEVSNLGSYIFTGQSLLINTVPGVAPYQNMINKYNLTDFFEITPYMIKTATTKEQLYGSVARMLGAKRGTDYIVFLKNKGIKGISSIGTTKAIRQDEAIYIIMQVYEKKTNRSVITIAIKNRQGVQNIGAFQSIYRNYVYAAVELGIVDNPNSTVLPSKQLSVEETLKMLYKTEMR